MAPLLRVRDVVAGYHGAVVLQGVSCDVEQGRITCVIGPNGAGKSTLLKTVSGVVPTLSGSIELDGTEIHRLSASGILARGVVQVPQQRALFPNLTLRENVLMGAYILRRRASVVRDRYAEIEELFPLVAERANDKAGNLSGGQRRAIEFARSLMLDPSVVLLDEPSLGLDPKSLAHVWGLITRMRDRSITILLVEQNVRLGLTLADQAIVMESGRVRMAGPAREILRNPEVADLYLGGTMKNGNAASQTEPRG